MKAIGILLALAGWLIPVVGVTATSSLTARYVLVLFGIALSLFGIIGVLNKAHLKEAIWKK